MAYEVFISYSKPDKTTADAVCGILEARGVRCWIAPRDVEPGCDWSASIISALNVVRVMVLVFSSHANESPHVRREVQRAFGKNVTVIPFRVEAVRPVESLEYYLAPVHWLDALTVPLEQHLEHLADIVQRVLSPEPPRNPPPVPSTAASAPVPEAALGIVTPPPAAPAPARARRATAGWILGGGTIAALLVAGLATRYFREDGQSGHNDDSTTVRSIDAPVDTRGGSTVRDETTTSSGVSPPAVEGDPAASHAVESSTSGTMREMPPELARQLATLLQNQGGAVSPAGDESVAAPPGNEGQLTWRDEAGNVIVTTTDGRMVDGDDAGSTSSLPRPIPIGTSWEETPIVGRDWTIPSLGLEMVYLYPDTFTLGSPPQEPGRAADEGPVTRVALSAGFWLGRHEVTREQWMIIMGPIDEQSAGAIDPETPVTQITCDAALEFCRKLTAQERAARRLPAGFVYALPTEVQWEYACRAGRATPFGLGRALGASLANIDGTQPYGGAAPDEMSDGPIPVGNYPPNEWGFFDMHGNVAEWTASAYTKHLPGGSVDDFDNLALGRPHVLRGGSWRDAAAACRSAARQSASPNVSNDTFGFRLALVRER